MLTNKEILAVYDSRLRVECDGDAYALIAHPWQCLEIVRRADGFSVFMQDGCECGDLIAELDCCETAAAVDAVLSQYDDVMTVPE